MRILLDILDNLEKEQKKEKNYPARRDVSIDISHVRVGKNKNTVVRNCEKFKINAFSKFLYLIVSENFKFSYGKVVFQEISDKTNFQGRITCDMTH